MVNDIAIRKMNKNVTLSVKIKFTRELKLRLWIATKLMNLAAIILGCGFDIETEQAPCDGVQP